MKTYNWIDEWKIIQLTWGWYYPEVKRFINHLKKGYNWPYQIKTDKVKQFILACEMYLSDNK